jgi:CDP-paratose 2-epimerase
VDVVVDAAANPSVLAGVDGLTSSRQLVEHNLWGTVNVLEFCRRHGATLIMLSTSRVYALDTLKRLPLRSVNGAFELDPGAPLPAGVSPNGLTEGFSTAPPLSMYGATKRASEQLALEYGSAYGFSVWINRCGVLAGAGQFGRGDQGICAYWITSWLYKQPLRYIGFGGCGHQVRDCLHPADVVPLIEQQMSARHDGKPRIVNASGGARSARSLAQLSEWCRTRIGPHRVEALQEDRVYDAPWIVLDSSLAQEAWNWRPTRTPDDIFEEILDHARQHPDWLALAGH